MDRVWKLPPMELSPMPRGGWAVQSEQGLGRAHAAFVPLRGADGAWDLAMAAGDVLQLTAVNDQDWTPVPFPSGLQGATHYLCLLRYEHPWNRPDNTFFVPESAQAAGRDEVRDALDRIRAGLEGPLEIHLVPAPAPSPQTLLMAKAAPPMAPAPDALCFAFASCQYPAGMLDRPVAHQSLERLADWLRTPQGPAPERLLLLGDQVYTDATYGLLDPARIDDRYSLPYEEFTDRSKGPFAALPQTFLGLRRMTPDDHEIRDNWEPTLHGDWDEERDAGIAAYWKYQRRSPPSGVVQILEQGPGWRLFMADSRTERELRDERTVQTATILGQRQTQDLEDWLAQVDRGELKIVTCASMVLPRTRINMDEPLYLDAWQGYPASLGRLLAFLCDHEVRNVVFLSGDAHLACDARIKVRRADGREVRFVSLHAPALYAPYPFANEEPANLLLQDHFAFRSGGQEYECEVGARVLAGGRNGCGLLRAERQDGHWCVAYEVLEPEPVS